MQSRENNLAQYNHVSKVTVQEVLINTKVIGNVLLDQTIGFSLAYNFFNKVLKQINLLFVTK